MGAQYDKVISIVDGSAITNGMQYWIDEATRIWGLYNGISPTPSTPGIPWDDALLLFDAAYDALDGAINGDHVTGPVWGLIDTTTEDSGLVPQNNLYIAGYKWSEDAGTTFPASHQVVGSGGELDEYGYRASTYLPLVAGYVIVLDLIAEVDLEPYPTERENYYSYNIGDAGTSGYQTYIDDLDALYSSLSWTNISVAELEALTTDLGTATGYVTSWHSDVHTNTITTEDRLEPILEFVKAYGYLVNIQANAANAEYQEIADKVTDGSLV